jgi:hypothetical protein
MILSNLLGTTKTVLNKNSPAIMVGVAITGVIVTSYLSGKATLEAVDIIQENEDLDRNDLLKKIAPVYIPTVVSGLLTIGCIIGSNRVSSKRAAAAYSVLALSERAFEEYKDKVTEKFGENKERAVRDEIAQDRVTNNPPNTTLITGTGSVLCCELFTGRYFNSDIETLRKAQNDINAKLVKDMYAPLSEFYYIVGLPTNSNAWNVGWESDKHMALEFTSVLSENNVPCLAFDYNYIKPI